MNINKRRTLDWIGPVARMGYATKGLLYGAVGVFAGMSFFRAGGQVSGTEAVLEDFRSIPGGTFLVGACIVGLLAYVAWRLAQGVLDVENKGSDFMGLVRRAGLVISGLFYAVLAGVGVNLLTGSSGNSGGGSSEKAAEAMSYPGGELAVFAFGAGFMATALYQLYRAWTDQYEEHWENWILHRFDRWPTRVSRFGVAARGLVFLVMSVYIMRAGWNENPALTKDFGSALEIFAQENWMLAGIAAGLCCYGLYCFVNAAGRRIPAG